MRGLTSPRWAAVPSVRRITGGLVEGIARELLDVRGAWHPAASASGSLVGELLDVHSSVGRLHGRVSEALSISRRAPTELRFRPILKKIRRDYPLPTGY